MLQVDLLAQLTLPHFVHCQSSAENKPFDFSAAEAPISIPCFLVFSSFFSRPHLLQLDLRAKLTLPHPASEQVQSPSDGLKSPPGILYFIFYRLQPYGLFHLPPCLFLATTAHIQLLTMCQV